MTSGVLKASEMAARIAFRTELKESMTLKSPDSILARDISKSLKIVVICCVFYPKLLLLLFDRNSLNWYDELTVC